jgi:hypothetical protein
VLDWAAASRPPLKKIAARAAVPLISVVLILFMVFLPEAWRNKLAAKRLFARNLMLVLNRCVKVTLRIQSPAQRIDGHADSRTTEFYDRRGQKVLLGDMKRIRY